MGVQSKVFTEKEKKNEKKDKTYKRIRNFMCFVFLFCISVIVVFFLWLLLRRGRRFPSDDTTLKVNTTSYENQIQTSLEKYNETFRIQIEHLCKATCSRRAQNTANAEDNHIKTNDGIMQTEKCVKCCQLLNKAECLALNIDQNKDFDCEWVLVGSGGACVSIPGDYTFPVFG